MIPTREALLEKAAHIPVPPIAIEAFWDGDTTGWFVILTMIYIDQSAKRVPYRDFYLAEMCGEGGDIRLFYGNVPPYPEAERAREVGEELATRFGVPFYFASPIYPEDQCPRWWERDQGYPCHQCGILLLQSKSCPWHGLCYQCHLAKERQVKEGGSA